jgi:toxin FitB
MIILDTNVISALMRDVPDPAVSQWLDRQPEYSIWTTAISVFEIRAGLAAMPEGSRRSALSEEFTRLLEEIHHRISGFGEEAARRAASLAADRQKKGRVGEMRDTMIAGIVLAQNATLATRNTAHFADVSAKVVNPWTS